MYGGTVTEKDLFFTKLKALVPDLQREEIIVSGDPIEALPCERPWLSAFGACMIGITAIRRNADGKIEFQLADEHHKPYGDGNEWATADRFWDEYPQ